MSARPDRVVLLGSQRDAPEVGRVVAEQARGRTALVTAGWQEWEEDDARIRELLGPGAVNLALYARAERVWRADAELAEAHRELGDRVRQLRRAYNARLAPAMDAWMHLDAMRGDPSVLDPERADALETVRALDRHQLARLAELRAEFEAHFRPADRHSVVRERDEVGRILADAAVLVVEGGHVPVLLNRLRLFGLRHMLAGKTVVACSGGAMALGERVVLFHDAPPWGPGHAEVGDKGLGVYDGVVPLPLPERRLRLDDPGRVSRLARRFAPDACVLLEPDVRAEWDGTWRPERARRLADDGAAEPWRGAA